MSVFAGIDLNSNTVDVVLLDEDSYEASHHRYRIDDGGTDLDAFDRARRLRDALPARTAWQEAGVLAIGIEKPMARNMQGIVPQMRVQGALIACLPPRIPIYELGPSTWKKLALGHGHASKEDGAVWVKRTVIWTVDRGYVPQDAIDACCIAEAARLRHAAQEGAAAA